ncbi:bacterial alpha-L-rhamnosidase-domain-containing protein [Aspergillus pseudoustus]|uniref:alpha-L-rhamnosidase n=1 Tax=Aspergillus pseudoustus TaxID=1810923 RepID=A0ABR4JR66_9EURO
MSRSIEVQNLRFEHHRQGQALGIGSCAPRVSWNYAAVNPDCCNWTQTEYDIDIKRRTPSYEPQVYHVDSPDSLLGSDSSPTGWSETAIVEAGLLEPSVWNDSFTTSSEPADPTVPHPPLLFRREFVLSPVSASQIQRAQIYATAHGVYELFVNVRRVGDQVLAPGWTDYTTRLEYRTSDVTALLQAGPSAVAIEAAEGCEILAATDGEWKRSTSATTSTEIYDGEHFNALLQQPGWTAAAFVGASWRPVATAALDTNILVAPLGSPIRAIEEVGVKQHITSPIGKTTLDFGQNLVGYIRISIPADRSLKRKVITLSYAEVLEQGEIATRSLRFAKAIDKLTLSGEALEWYPKFTFHGFRYAQIGGLEVLSCVEFTAIVIHSDVARTGWFSCSNPLLNQLHSNIVWSMRGNFVGLPTDYPQRDKRLGYTGDLQVFVSTGNFVYDTCGPNFLAAVWGDCAAIVPWGLYKSFGDLDLLRTQYQSMVNWMKRGIKRDERGLWDSSCTFQLGDWLDPYAPPKEPARSATDPQLVAGGYLVHVTGLVARVCGSLGDIEAANRYREQRLRLRRAFQEDYVTPSGRMPSDSQTAFALPIFDLVSSASARKVASDRLACRIRYHDRLKIGTGFVGTPIIGHSLTQGGQSQLFYRMLLHKKNPSWLYPVTMGATTIWERWDSMLPDRSINTGEMTSCNHYAFGAVGDWLHRAVGGMHALEPGWKRFGVSPVPGGGLESAEVSYESAYGRIEFRWKLAGDGNRLRASLLVPPNTVAQVQLPGQPMEEVGAGRYEFDVAIEPYTWPLLPIYPPYLPHEDDEP